MLAIEAIRTPFDPARLYLTRAIRSATTVELLWRAPAGARVYEVYADGTLIGRPSGTAFLVEDLREGTDHAFEIVALDAAGETIVSERVSVNTAARSRPRVARPFRFEAEATIYSATEALLRWTLSSRAGRYEVYRDGEPLRRLDVPEHRHLYLTGLSPDRPATYRVVALDRCDGVVASAETRIDTSGGRAFELPSTTRDVLDEVRYALDTGDEEFALNRQPYLSGVITSYDAFRFRYGRVEARARMPAGNGYWSAFWLLNAYYGQDQPEDPEIDIVEALGERTDRVYQVYHRLEDRDGDGLYTDRVSDESRVPVADFSDDFHVYRVDWEPGRLVWYVDGVETKRIEGEAVSDEQMYLIANLAVGGGFPVPPDASTPFPGRFEIDWIRVWQR